MSRIYSLCEKMAQNGFACKLQKRHRGHCKNERCEFCGAEELKKTLNRKYPWCVPCYRKTHAGYIKDYRVIKPRGTQHAISQEAYEWMHVEQEGRCALCNSLMLLPHVDHAHDCEIKHSIHRGCPACVRGLLCHKCNPSLGHSERLIQCGVLQPTEKLLNYLTRRPLWNRMKRS